MCALRWSWLSAACLAGVLSLAPLNSAYAEAPALDLSPSPPPVGSSAADPLPVEGPAGDPASLDDILSDAGIAPPASPLPETFICFGNEPFWSLTVEQGVTASFSTPDTRLPQSYTVFDTLTAIGRPDYPIALDLYAGLRSGYAIINHEACSDGMSDVTHLWSAQLLLKDQRGMSLLTGCCRRP